VGKDGDVGTWVGQGVGTIKPGGIVSYRGAIFLQSASPKWAVSTTLQSSLSTKSTRREYQVNYSREVEWPTGDLGAGGERLSPLLSL
jgi:hypothetical protein